MGLTTLSRWSEVRAQSSRISDEQLLARAINGEARGEPYEGQVAVGAVILNRTRDPDFPNHCRGYIPAGSVYGSFGRSDKCTY